MCNYPMITVLWSVFMISSSMEQQAAGKQQVSSRWAATSVCPLERMIKYILKNQRDKKKWTVSSRTAPKQWNCSITKSCGDAKLELFPGARPPDTTFTSWYDLTLALVETVLHLPISTAQVYPTLGVARWCSCLIAKLVNKTPITFGRMVDVAN